MASYTTPRTHPAAGVRTSVLCCRGRGRCIHYTPPMFMRMCGQQPTVHTHAHTEDRRWERWYGRPYFEQRTIGILDVRVRTSVLATWALQRTSILGSQEYGRPHFERATLGSKQSALGILTVQVRTSVPASKAPQCMNTLGSREYGRPYSLVMSAWESRRVGVRTSVPEPPRDKIQQPRWRPSTCQPSNRHRSPALTLRGFVHLGSRNTEAAM